MTTDLKDRSQWRRTIYARSLVPRCARCDHEWTAHEEPWPLPSDFAGGTWCGFPECECEEWAEPEERR